MSGNSTTLDTIYEIIKWLAPILPIYLTYLIYKLKKQIAEIQKTYLAETNEKQSNAIKNLDNTVHSLESNLNNMVHRLESKFESFIDYSFSYLNIGSVPQNTTSNLISPSFQQNQLSLFQYRKVHYSAEKILLCKHIIDHVLQNIRFSDYPKVYFLIDSGSTVYPLFKLLCSDAVIDFIKSKERENDKDIVQPPFEIITNNIQGIQSILTYGRKSNNISAEMKVPCHVIPGNLEGKYDAILSSESITHLSYKMERIKSEHLKKNEKYLVISIISGNYISTQDGVLWRGNFHGAMKDAMVKYSNLTYIVAPLGKIFSESTSEINDMIKESSIYLNFETKDYKDLRDIETDADLLEILEIKNLKKSDIDKLLPNSLIMNKDIFLFTTSRSNTGDSYPKPLMKRFIKIEALLTKIYNEKIIRIDFDPGRDSDHVMVESQKHIRNPEVPYYNYEFPHQEIRAKMTKKYCQTNQCSCQDKSETLELGEIP